jgi:CxxC motif-containing protein (DUF1111 family)
MNARYWIPVPRLCGSGLRQPGMTKDSLSSFPRRRESRILSAILLGLYAHMLPAQDFSKLDAAAGKALFERNWVAAPASTAAADGLGPYYTARSCAACHANGGGSSDISALNLIIDDPVYGHLLQPRAVTGMVTEAVVSVTWEQADTQQLADGTTIHLHAPAVTVSEWQYGDASRSINLRRAPTLQGLAALERIPQQQLLSLADPDDRNADGISGRVPAGRFGWKSSTRTLREQVAHALSLDLGLSTSLFPLPQGDCTEHQPACLARTTEATGDPLEAPDTVLNLLLTYLQTLLPPPSPAANTEGAALFAELGCPACHVPQLDSENQVLHPYSDLLLHDMGSGLADTANAALMDSRPELANHANTQSAESNEWRTPPLWELSQTSRFLHDARAATLEEAILWHGGEAQVAREAYARLNAAKRALLQQWLLGL